MLWSPAPRYILDTPPQVGGSLEQTRSLSQRNVNCGAIKAFVMISSIWSLVEMKWTFKLPLATWSRTVKINFDMFCMNMKNEIRCQILAPKLLHHRMGGLVKEIPNSRRSEWSHMSPAVVLAKARYSDSVEERSIVCCLWADQEIRLQPKYMANPSVDFRSSGQLAQSASEKAWMAKDEDLEMNKPRDNVCLTYRNMRFTLAQCSWVGMCINWQTLLTAKEGSGRVSVACWSAPTMLR